MGPSTSTQSEVTRHLGEGASTCTQPKVRTIITPPENITWSTVQLAPFVQRLSPGQPVEGEIISFLSFVDCKGKTMMMKA